MESNLVARSSRAGRNNKSKAYTAREWGGLTRHAAIEIDHSEGIEKQGPRQTNQK